MPVLASGVVLFTRLEDEVEEEVEMIMITIKKRQRRRFVFPHELRCFFYLFFFVLFFTAFR